MKLGIFMMPLHPASRDPAQTLQEDREAIIFADRLGFHDAFVGERVWLHSTQWKRPFGTAADFAVTPSKRAVALPEKVSMEMGASLGVPAMTAHRAVFGQGPVTGKTVLVTGGAGAVGFYAIQLAKWAGARVITTVSDRKSTRLNSSHIQKSRMPSSA